MAEDHDRQPEVAYAVGDVVSGTASHVDGYGSLWLYGHGWVGVVLSDELSLANGESTQERYAVGETIDGLFVIGALNYGGGELAFPSSAMRPAMWRRCNGTQLAMSSPASSPTTTWTAASGLMLTA